MQITDIKCCGYDISQAVKARVLCFHEIHTTETINEQVVIPTRSRLATLNKHPPKSFVLLHSQSYEVMGFSGQRVNLDIVVPEKQVLFFSTIASRNCALALRQKCLEDIDDYIRYVEADAYDLTKFIGKNRPYRSKKEMIDRLRKERRHRQKMKDNAFLNLREGFFVPVPEERLTAYVIKLAWQRFCKEFKLARIASLPVRFLKDENLEAARQIIVLLADLPASIAKKQGSEEIGQILRAEILGILGLA